MEGTLGAGRDSPAAVPGGADEVDLAQVAALDDFLEGDGLGNEAGLKVDGQDAVGGFGGLHHLARVGRVQRQRLLAKDVLACRQRGQGGGVMDWVGGADADRIHGVQAEELVVVAKDLGDAIVTLHGCQGVLRNVGRGDDLALVGNRLVAADVGQPGDLAGADDADAQLPAAHGRPCARSVPLVAGPCNWIAAYFSAEKYAGSMKVLVTPATMGPSFSESASMAAQAGSWAKASHWRCWASRLS